MFSRESKLIFHLSNFRRANKNNKNMAGNAGEARKYVFLLFNFVFYALGFHLKEEPILAKFEIARN